MTRLGGPGKFGGDRGSGPVTPDRVVQSFTWNGPRESTIATMREGWIYVIAFFVIIGVGGFLIVPRLLDGGRGPRDPYDDPIPEIDDPDSEAATPPADVADAIGAATDWVDIEVTGPNGILRGPLKATFGARIERRSEEGEPVQRLRVFAEQPRVAFGAVGHQWHWVSAAELGPETRIELPEAAPSIVVRVREPDGRPAENVAVRVEPASPWGLRRTDEGGALILDDLTPGFVIVDCTTTERRGPRLRLRTGVDKDVEAILEAAWRIRGRVVNPDGKPVPDARVSGYGVPGPLGVETTTAKDGSFTWRGPVTALLSLRARATGYAEHAVELSPPAVGATETEVGDLQLTDAETRIECEVLSTAGDPGAYVMVEPQVAALLREVFGPGQVLDEPRKLPLDEHGEATFTGLLPNVPLRVSVRGAGVPVDSIVQGAPGETVSITFDPPDGEVLEGVLRHPDGEPARGVRVLVSREPRDGDQPRPDDLVAYTGPKGGFRLRGLPGLTYFVRAYVPGRRSLLRQVELPTNGPLLMTMETAITDDARRVEGTVTNQRNEPLRGVTVRAAGISAVSDAEGRFRLEGVESMSPNVVLAYGYEPGPLAADAPHPRPYLPRDFVLITPGRKATHKLVLAESAAVSFRAVDGVDDTPISFLHVMVRTDKGRILFDRGVATRDGAYTIPDLPSRGVKLALLTHSRRSLKTLPLKAGTSEDLGDVTLGRGMQVRGVVTNKAGDPVAGARVAAFDDGWRKLSSDQLVARRGLFSAALAREVLFRTTRTNEKGEYVLQGFDPQEPADLAFWAPGYAPRAKRVELERFSDNVRTVCDMQLEEGGWLRLLLQEEGSSRPVEDAMVDMEHGRDASDWLDLLHRGTLGGPLGTTEEWRTASDLFLIEDEPGVYFIGPALPGPYQVWIERPGYAPIQKKLTVLTKDQNVLELIDQDTGEKYAGNITKLIFTMQRLDD